MLFFAIFIFSLSDFQSKDLGGAEEYYSRAILMDPRDGEILSQYAKLTWELHRDEERSLSYFQRAVQASPDNRFVSGHTFQFSFYNLGFFMFIKCFPSSSLQSRACSICKLSLGNRGRKR